MKRWYNEFLAKVLYRYGGPFHWVGIHLVFLPSAETLPCFPEAKTFPVSLIPRFPQGARPRASLSKPAPGNLLRNSFPHKRQTQENSRGQPSLPYKKTKHGLVLVPTVCGAAAEEWGVKWYLCFHQNYRGIRVRVSPGSGRPLWCFEWTGTNLSLGLKMASLKRLAQQQQAVENTLYMPSLRIEECMQLMHTVDEGQTLYGSFAYYTFFRKIYTQLVLSTDDKTM